MNQEQKIDLFNQLARHIRPAFYEYKPIESIDIQLKDTGLDSLDFVMMGIFLATIYGVPDHIAKDFAPETPRQFFELMEQHKRQDPPATVEEAMEMIK